MSEENDTQAEDFAADSDAVGEDSPTKKPAGGLKFLTVLMLLLAVGLFVFPFVWGLEDKGKVSPDSSVLNDWLLWLGDLHVVVLHIPIGIFALVLTMEILGLLSFGKFKPQLRFALFMNAITAVVAVVFGYFYFLRGDYGSAPLEFELEGNRMGMHMWLSILFAAFVILAFISKMWAHHQQKWSPFYPLFIIIAAASMTVGAHMGGELVHTDKDLVGDFEKLRNGEPLGVAADEIEKMPVVTDIPAGERLVYSQIVKPILHGKCWECHADADLNPLGKKKIKGRLVMTSVADLLKGGKGGEEFPTLIPGDSANSEMMIRVNLDVDEDEFMPTGKEDEPHMHLTDGEKKILAWWIDSTPLIDEVNDKPLAEVAGHEAILAEVAAFEPVRDAMAVPSEKVEEKKVIEEVVPEVSLRDKVQEAKAPLDQEMPGALTFSSTDSAELFFTSVSQGKDFSDEDLAKLAPVAEAVVDLDVKKTAVSDKGMETVATMLNLRKLMLNETKVTDAGVKTIAVLPNLESLSLFGTAVTDKGIVELAKASSLKKVYLSNTKVTPAGADALAKSLPEAKIEFTVPEPPKPQEEPKQEAPEQEEVKKEEVEKEDSKPAPAPALKLSEEKAEVKPENDLAPAPKSEEVEKPEPAKPAPAKPAEEKMEETKPKQAPAPEKEEEQKPDEAPQPAPDKQDAAKPAPAPKKAEPTPPAPKPAEEKVEPAPEKKEAPSPKPEPAPAPEPVPAEKKETKPSTPAPTSPKEEAQPAPENAPAPEPTPEKKEAAPTPAPTPTKEEPKPAPVKPESNPEPNPEPAPEKKEAPAPQKGDESTSGQTPEERAKEAIEKLRKAAEGN